MQLLGIVVGGRTVAGARAGAVQVLAPEQELDGVIAGGDIGLDASSLLQQLASSSGVIFDGVDLLAADASATCWR